MHLHDRILHAQQDEGDQRHAGYAVGLEPVGARPDRVAGVVAGAVGDHAGIARVVFLDLEHDLHQVRADVGDLGEDAAGDAQRRGAQRFADGETDETRPRVIAGNEKQDEEHHQQFHADQHHADAHAGLQRNLINRVGLAAQPGKRRPRIGKSIYADSEPSHSVTSGDSQQAEQQNDRKRNADGLIGHRGQHTEVQHDDDGDENPQKKQEFALRDEIGFAGFVNQLGNFPHGAVHRQIFQTAVNGQPEDQPEDAKQNPDRQQLVAVHPKESDLRKVGKLQARLAAWVFLSRGARRAQQSQQGGCRACFRESASKRASAREPGTHQ